MLEITIEDLKLFNETKISIIEGSIRRVRDMFASLEKDMLRDGIKLKTLQEFKSQRYILDLFLNTGNYDQYQKCILEEATNHNEYLKLNFMKNISKNALDRKSYSFDIQSAIYDAAVDHVYGEI